MDLNYIRDTTALGDKVVTAVAPFSESGPGDDATLVICVFELAQPLEQRTHNLTSASSLNETD